MLPWIDEEQCELSGYEELYIEVIFGLMCQSERDVAQGCRVCTERGSEVFTGQDSEQGTERQI